MGESRKKPGGLKGRLLGTQSGMKQNWGTNRALGKACETFILESHGTEPQGSEVPLKRDRGRGYVFLMDGYSNSLFTEKKTGISTKAKVPAPKENSGLAVKLYQHPAVSVIGLQQRRGHGESEGGMGGEGTKQSDLKAKRRNTQQGGAHSRQRNGVVRHGYLCLK